MGVGVGRKGVRGKKRGETITVEGRDEWKKSATPQTDADGE